MKALYDVGYPTPTPIAQIGILYMSLVRGRSTKAAIGGTGRRHLRAVDWYGRPVGSTRLAL
jgi:hypothetical protein